MQLNLSEIIRRCDKVLDASITRPDQAHHTRFAINVYLSVSHFLGDIDEDAFRVLISYYSSKIDKLQNGKWI